MNEFNEAAILPPFDELFADSAPSEATLEQMLAVAVDPATPDPGSDLIPDPSTLVAGSEESLDVDLGDFDGDAEVKLDPSDPFSSDILDSGLFDPLTSGDDLDGFDGSFGDDPLADF